MSKAIAILFDAIIWSKSSKWGQTIVQVVIFAACNILKPNMKKKNDVLTKPTFNEHLCRWP